MFADWNDSESRNCHWHHSHQEDRWVVSKRSHQNHRDCHKGEHKDNPCPEVGAGGVVVTGVELGGGHLLGVAKGHCTTPHRCTLDATMLLFFVS